MTNNTINNVPRELLERVLDYDGAVAIRQNARHELRALISAPSPAGVDGLEVVAWQDAENPLYTTAERRVMHEWADNQYQIVELCRLSDATAIIDGLRGEVAELQSMITNLSRAGIRMRTERDQQAQRIGELASHLEFAVTMLTVAGLAGNAQVEAMRAALSAGKEGE